MAESIKSTPTPTVKIHPSISDLIIDAFALDELALRDALHHREHEVVMYRELAQEAMHTLAAETARRRIFQRKYYALLQDWRRGGAA